MKDPAFLFYPGDYLRDTQCLDEKVQVAYDRIMCEHLRNICISETQLNFFTKGFTGDEKAQLISVLSNVEGGGYQIGWVAESFTKRLAYSESRRKNRNSKPKKDTAPNPSVETTYVEHMENGIENENRNEDENGKEGMGEKPAVALAVAHVVYPFAGAAFAAQWAAWKRYRLTEHRFAYRSPESEQAALKELATLSSTTETTAIAILHQSMGKGWKGLFALTPEHGSKPPAGQSRVRYSDDFKRKVAERLQSGKLP